MKRKASMGHQKIEMKRIQNEEARQVCFSKCRTGIFKKATELSILCGAEIGVAVFSPAGKAFSFGHPSVDAVINRFLDNDPNYTSASPRSPTMVKELNHQLTELTNLVETEKKRCDAIEEALKGLNLPTSWLNNGNNMEEWGLDEIKEYERRVMELRDDVAMRADQLLTMAEASNYNHRMSLTWYPTAGAVQFPHPGFGPGAHAFFGSSLI